jgi:1-acyl-sn-glycerol-3-phosphate acyltransferase
VPIVPIVAEPLAAIADTERHLARPGTLRVTVLEPIDTDTGSARSVAELSAIARSRMQEELDRLRTGR